MQTGLIQPASSVIANAGIQKISTLLTEHNKKVRLESAVKQTKIITIGENGVVTSHDNEPKSEAVGVAAGDARGSGNLQESSDTEEQRKKEPQFLIPIAIINAVP